MARFRKIDVRIWGDAKFRALTPIPPCAQGLWFYLLTTPKTTSIPGVVCGGQAAMAEALRWPLEGFRQAFGLVFLQGMAEADWESRLVWIPKAIEHNPPESPNVIRSWRVHWDEVPECDLKVKIWRNLRAYVEGLGEGFQKAFREACPEPSPKAMANQEQEQEQEQKKVPAADAAPTLNLSSEPPPPAKLTDRLISAYLAVHGRKPVWAAKKHFVQLAKLQKALGDDEVERRFRHYLACDKPFFAGHPLDKFCSNADEFATPSGKKPSEQDQALLAAMAEAEAYHSGKLAHLAPEPKASTAPSPPLPQDPNDPFRAELHKLVGALLPVEAP